MEGRSPPSSTMVLDVPSAAIGDHVVLVYGLGEDSFDHFDWRQGDGDGVEYAKIYELGYLQHHLEHVLEMGSRANAEAFEDVDDVFFAQCSDRGQPLA